MTRFRQRPRRTTAVVLLDLTTRSLTALRAAVRWPLPRRTLGAVVAATLAVLVGAATLAVVLLPGPPANTPSARQGAPEAAREATPHPGSPGIDAGAASPVSLAAPGPGPSSGTPTRPVVRPAPTPLPLAAQYATVDTALLSYGASVIITNPGPVPVSGWTLVVTLPGRTLTVSEVSGARASQSDAVWTFIPEPETRQVAAGGAVEVRFRVNGSLLSAAPTGCALDGRPCAVTPR
ncbi:cellulose binding domain-containing protein [Micromonospora sp. NPDC049679]|uniref:cellulose binding domain-containing protein n=1 Tax=Micromonospora sp. NPDC049679 TaxID=3155920 RepID=UPI0034103686